MNESERIIELLTQIRDELRESREKTLRRYDDVLSAQAKTDEQNREQWRSDLEEWQSDLARWNSADQQSRFGRWWSQFSAVLVILLAAAILLLAFFR